MAEVSQNQAEIAVDEAEQLKKSQIEETAKQSKEPETDLGFKNSEIAKDDQKKEQLNSPEKNIVQPNETKLDDELKQNQQSSPNPLDLMNPQKENPKESECSRYRQLFLNGDSGEKSQNAVFKKLRYLFNSIPPGDKSPHLFEMLKKYLKSKEGKLDEVSMQGFLKSEFGTTLHNHFINSKTQDNEMFSVMSQFFKDEHGDIKKTLNDKNIVGLDSIELENFCKFLEQYDDLTADSKVWLKDNILSSLSSITEDMELEQETSKKVKEFEEAVKRDFTEEDEKEKLKDIQDIITVPYEITVGLFANEELKKMFPELHGAIKNIVNKVVSFFINLFNKDVVKSLDEERSEKLKKDSKEHLKEFGEIEKKMIKATPDDKKAIVEQLFNTKRKNIFKFINTFDQITLTPTGQKEKDEFLKEIEEAKPKQQNTEHRNRLKGQAQQTSVKKRE